MKHHTRLGGNNSTGEAIMQKPWKPMCQHRPILPDRRRSSIVGGIELNCRVRNGNGWTLNVKSTNSEQFLKQVSKVVHIYIFKQKRKFYKTPEVCVTNFRISCENSVFTKIPWCTFRDSNPGPTD